MENQNQNVASDLELSESKQSNLHKLDEQLHSHASSAVEFSVEWKKLESHFDSIRTVVESLSEREKAFSLREKEFEVRESRMESGFELKKKQLETHFSELEKASSLRENELAERESRFESDFESKKKEFERLGELIGDRMKEIEMSQGHSESLQTLIDEYREELEVKEKEFKAMERSIAKKSSELDSLKGLVEEQEKKLDHTEDSVKATRRKIWSLEKKANQRSAEIASKQRRLNDDIASQENKLKELRENVVSKEEEIKACQSSIGILEKEIQSKGDELNFVSTELNSIKDQVKACQSSIPELENEIQSKEDKLKAVSDLIESCSSELESKETRLKFVREEVEAKEKILVSLKNSEDQITRACEKRKKEIEHLSKELELEKKSCESKVEEFNLIRGMVQDLLTEVESREKSLETKERQFEKRLIKFESTCSRNEKAIIIHPASNRNPRPNEGRELRLLLNQHLKTHDSVCEKVFSILRASANPPKLALDAVEGLFPSESSEESREFNSSVIRRSCILVLEQLEKLLMEDSRPDIAWEVRDQAKTFADSWRAKMRKTETNNLEALGFLQFLTSFRLNSEYDPNEIYELREAISTADREFVVPDIDLLATIMMRPPIFKVQTTWNILRILEKSTDPGRFVLEYICRFFSQQLPDTNLLLNCIILFEQLLKVSPRIDSLLRTDAMKLAVDWNKKLESRGESSWDMLVLLQFLETYDMVHVFEVEEILKLFMKISRDSKVLETCRRVGIAERIPDMIQYLIGKKNLFDVVRLICAFNLADQYEPVKLLNDYMNYLKMNTAKNCNTKVKKPIEEKERVTNEEIMALRAVRDCVRENNLECPMLSLRAIDSCIDALEKCKLQRRQARDRKLLALAEPPPRRYKQARGPGGGFDPHQEQGRHKIPRTTPHG